MGKKAIAAGATAAVLALTAPFVAYHEGYIPHTYSDPVGVPTICYGHTATAATVVTRTRMECLQLLHGDLGDAVDTVNRCIHVPLAQGQAAALVSAAYNIGPKVVCGSTLQRKANAGQPFCAELSRWVYAKGRVLPGLVKRREAERAMCEGR